MKEIPAGLQGLLLEKMQYDQRLRLERFAALNPMAQPGGIVFVGDSITEQFPVDELFRGSRQPVFNRGIGGITTGYVQGNLSSLLGGLRPQTIVLLIGTNDFMECGEPGVVAARIQKTAGLLRGVFPEADLVLLGLLPVNPAVNPAMVAPRHTAAIEAANALLAAPGTPYTFMHCTARLADATGELNPAYTTDGLHLNLAGYQQLAGFLRERVDGLQ